MSNRIRPTCIIGIAINKKNLGFCVLEEPYFLLDWGVKKIVDREPETIEKLLVHVFNFYEPINIYFENTSSSDCKLSRKNIEVLSIIERLANSKRITTSSFSAKEVKINHTLPSQANLDFVANSISNYQPILKEYLPRVRRAWDGERRAMVLFKAIALIPINNNT